METDNLYKPKTLPQVSAPFSYVAHHLNDIGQPYEMIGAPVDSITPSQAFIDSDIVSSLMDKLKNGEELKAMWLDKDNNALDGHHRSVAYQMNGNSHIPAVRLLCDKETAIKHLNDIQKMYENENNSDFLNELFKNNDTSMYVPEKPLPTKKEEIKIYKEKGKPIDERAANGNFYALIPTEKYSEEDTVSLDSVLESDDVDSKIKTAKNPVVALAEIWFPGADFKAHAKQIGWRLPLDQFISTMVAERARTKKIDAIKYGDRVIQIIGDR